VWLKVGVPFPLERTLIPTFKTQPIREAVGLQNTIKLKREEILGR
jgi:hypothetical protein